MRQIEATLLFVLIANVLGCSGAAAPTSAATPAPNVAVDPNDETSDPTPTPTPGPDVTPPTAGAFAPTTELSPSGFTLHWSAATDDVTVAADLAYLVCSGADLASIDEIHECEAATVVSDYTAGSLSTTVTGLAMVTSYFYNVVVKDAAGNKSIYNGKTQSTDGIVAATNVHNKQRVATGVVLGTATAGVTPGCQFDNGAAFQAAGTTSWKCSLPHGAGSWKLGSTHTLTVGVFNAGTLTSTTTYSVVRGRNQDINGDGYPDIAIAAPLYTGGGYKGQVYVYYSQGAAGLAAAPAAGTASSVLTGDANNDVFGNALAVDDINGDGIADLIVSAQGANTNSGYVYVFHSSATAPTGLAATLSASDANSVIVGGNGNEMAMSLSTGDVNGDGFTDVIAGSTTYDNYKGAVFIFHSSASGIGPTRTEASANTLIPGDASNDYVGSKISAGDFNGDGFVDIAVGAFFYPAAAGKGCIYVYLSSASGITATDTAHASSQILGEADGDELSAGMAVGDVNGDGFADIVAGADGYDVAGVKGRGYVFKGSSGGFAPSIAASSANTIINGPSVYEAFGNNVALGDVNGDGRTDIVMGGSGWSDTFSGKGRVYVFHGPSGGFPATMASGSRDSILTGAADGDSFGIGNSVVDVNGDGRGDLLVSAYGTGGTYKGRVYLFPSSASGLGASVTTAGAQSVMNGTANNDNFGQGFGNEP